MDKLEKSPNLPVPLKLPVVEGIPVDAGLSHIQRIAQRCSDLQKDLLAFETHVGREHRDIPALQARLKDREIELATTNAKLSKIENEYNFKIEELYKQIAFIKANHQKEVCNYDQTLAKVASSRDHVIEELRTQLQQAHKALCDQTKKYTELQCRTNALADVVKSGCLVKSTVIDKDEVSQVMAVRVDPDSTSQDLNEDRYQFHCVVDGEVAWRNLMDFTPLESFLIDHLRSRKSSLAPKKPIRRTRNICKKEMA